MLIPLVGEERGNGAYFDAGQAPGAGDCFIIRISEEADPHVNAPSGKGQVEPAMYLFAYMEAFAAPDALGDVIDEAGVIFHDVLIPGIDMPHPERLQAYFQVPAYLDEWAGFPGEAAPAIDSMIRHDELKCGPLEPPDPWRIRKDLHPFPHFYGARGYGVFFPVDVDKTEPA